MRNLNDYVIASKTTNSSYWRLKNELLLVSSCSVLIISYEIKKNVSFNSKLRNLKEM